MRSTRISSTGRPAVANRMSMFRHLARLREQNIEMAKRPIEGHDELLDPARGIIRGVLAGAVAWCALLALLT